MTRTCRKPGFTLIEMAAASAAAAILMLCVVMLLGAIVRDRERMLKVTDTSDAPNEAVVDLIRRDCALATTLRIETHGRLRLWTHASVAADGFHVTDRPSVVLYELAPVDGQRVLLRVQTFADESDQAAPAYYPVAFGVRNFKVIPLKDDSGAAADWRSPHLNQDQPVPNRLRLEVAFDRSPARLDRMLCLR